MTSTPEHRSVNTVREARPEDAEGFVDVHFRTWLATYPKFVPEATEDSIKKRFHYSETDGLKEHIAIAQERIAHPDPGTKQFVSVDETGKINGLAVAGPNAGGQKEIRAIYVDPDVQGKGMGGQLMHTALEYLDATHNEVVLDVALKNDNAISFYTKFGFVKMRDIPENEVRLNLSDSTFYIPEMQMIRPPAPIV